MITVRTPLHIRRVAAGRRRLAHTPRPSATALGRIPRVARLMALAIRFDGMLRDGTVKDHSTLARLAGVTPARITQIMNLTLLAPDIQEELLFLPPVEQGRDPLKLLDVQRIAADARWDGQREAWGRMRLARE